MDAKVDLNRRRARLLVATAGGVVVAVVLAVLVVASLALGLGLPGVLVAVVVAAAVGAGSAVAAASGAAGSALAATGARPVSEGDEPRLHNLVEGLCVGIGLPKPDVRVVDDPAPNALAIGRDADSAAVVVTRGLLDDLTRVELEAVLAHELSRIRGGDIGPGSLAVTFLHGGGDGPAALPVRVAAPATRALVARLAPERSSSLTDRAAVQVTRYPPALVAALEKLRADPAEVAAPPALAHLWIEPPAVAVPPAVARVYEAPPPIDERIATLLEL